MSSHPLSIAVRPGAAGPPCATALPLVTVNTNAMGKPIGTEG
jgi:hypothetical protein